MRKRDRIQGRGRRRRQQKVAKSPTCCVLGSDAHDPPPRPCERIPNRTVLKNSRFRFLRSRSPMAGLRRGDLPLQQVWSWTRLAIFCPTRSMYFGPGSSFPYMLDATGLSLGSSSGTNKGGWYIAYDNSHDATPCFKFHLYFEELTACIFRGVSMKRGAKRKTATLTSRDRGVSLGRKEEAHGTGRMEIIHRPASCKHQQFFAR